MTEEELKIAKAEENKQRIQQFKEDDERIHKRMKKLKIVLKKIAANKKLTKEK
mgnify:CR=1 FL=1|tara:strand:+ start:380 stop:538 length:159 start_codon:yes stop_codon:yes gene_type:complete